MDLHSDGTRTSVVHRGHARHFLRQLLRRPDEIVALAPSSRALSREMAAMADLSGPVIELGAGTGRITEALLAAGCPAAQLHLLEMNAEFVALLQERFPGVHVHHTGAQNIAGLGLGEVSAVVSGLPLLSMPKPVQRAIVGGAFELLRPGGRFVQFTYGPVPPVAGGLRDELDLCWDKSRRIWRNLPPAHVYSFARKADMPYTR